LCEKQKKLSHLLKDHDYLHESWQKQHIFLFSKRSRQAVQSTQLIYNDCSPPSYDTVKNEWRYNSTLLYALWHREDFTFLYSYV